MKQIQFFKLFSIVIVLALGLGLGLMSCNILMPPDHSVRVTNQYSKALSIRIGSVNFGQVAPNATTDYKGIDEGTHTIGGDVSGVFTVDGYGSHKWTVTITASGGASAKED